MNIPDTKRGLIVSLGARLERAQHELREASIAYLQIAITGHPEEAERQVRALGELWRHERLNFLLYEVLNYGPDADVSYACVYFFALDVCNPKEVPSFREWLMERTAKVP